eukprot:TRINITY_DN8287_c0_g1_i1.p3 TRINITY_DN8287_c0_g1~~TRINITY_DN8287_c0_g1_i1.p3  ORF type:complete len:226 (+),score=94.31 TRINITY_DN8287_c0_g1_i1:73-750(+)
MAAPASVPLFTVENALRAALVVSALKRPPVPFLDMGPAVDQGLAHDLLQVAKGCRNGMWYGARIRFAHAVVMALLFGGRGTWQERVVKILRNTWTHAKNLGSFAALFKLLLVVLVRLSGKRRHWHPAVAGLIGGSYVWSTSDPIAVQINLYLLSRVLFGAAKITAAKLEMMPGKEQTQQNYLVFGSLVWAAVMWQFYNHPLKLQSSLAASMVEIYTDSDAVGPRD